MPRFLLTSCALAASFGTACGSRTPLGVVLANDDPNIVVTDSLCRADAECGDQVACTLDRCDPTTHRCFYLLQHASCDDHVYCNGEERCDQTTGCISQPRGRECADSVACTVDRCDEIEMCVHIPDNSACPISHVCDPALGCQARALAHDSARLYDVRLPSGAVTPIGSTGPALTDIALHPSNVVYGFSGNAIYTVDQATGEATLFRSMSDAGQNAADASPDGRLFVAGGPSLFAVDLATGAATFVMSLPGGRTSSGDLAFVGERLLATVRGFTLDELAELDLASRTSKVIGSIGYSCVWGLAQYGMILYGFTCEGLILSIDTQTGKGVEVARSSVAFWGASAR